jgi:Tol biopolymer transport system component
MKQLTRDGRLKMDPVFVRPDEIVCTFQESPTLLALVRLRLADGTTERLHPEATTTEFEPAFSPDGRYCAFVQSRGNLSLKLVIRDRQEKRDAVFDPGGGFLGMRRPTIAPDGSRVVFSIPTAAGQELASVNLRGQDRRSLLTGGINNWPAFSPDGKRIAFCSSRDGALRLYVMNADGSHLQRLTSGPGFAARPAWSPDGKRLAFTANRDGLYRVCILAADGSGLQVLSGDTDRDDYPAWSPDGRRVVMVRERHGRSDLVLLDVPAADAGR